MMIKKIPIILSFLLLSIALNVFADEKGIIPNGAPVLTRSEQKKIKDNLKEIISTWDHGVKAASYAECVSSVQKVLDMATKSLGNDSFERAELLRILGNVYTSQKDYVLAEQAYEESLRIYRLILPVDSMDLVDAKKRLVTVYLLDKKYALAKPLLEECLVVEDKALGKDHQHTRASRKYLETINKKLSEGKNEVATEGTRLTKVSSHNAIVIRPITSNKVILIISILLYFFITALGILKGAEKKTVYFFTKKDYKIVLITGIASLAGIFIIFLFLSKSILLAGLTGFIFWAIIFILINIIWSYRLNPKMHIIPAIVGFSRSSVVFFIPIMEYIASVFAKDKTFIEREGEEFNETLKRLDAHPSLKLQISWTTLVFIHGTLINGNYVEMARIIQSSERTTKAFEELKKQTGKAKTPEKDSNSNLGGGPDRSTADEGEYTYNSQDSVSDINLESDVVSAYEIIGISESASDEEVKTAYRKKIMEYHPDRTGGLGDKLKDVAEEETKKLNNAYDKIMKSRGH